MDTSKQLMIINVNMQGDDGERVPHDKVNQWLKSLSDTLDKHGLKNFLIVPHYGSLGRISMITPTDDSVIYVALDDNIKKMSPEDFKDALNTKLREMSDTEDGLNSEFDWSDL